MKKKSVNDIIAELDKTYRHWELLYRDGGQDPFYTDGVNLNLVRNHIIYFKAELKEMQAPKDGEQISFFESGIVTDDRPVPPEVPASYMAQPNRIRMEAEKALKLLQNSSDVQIVLSSPAAKETAAYHHYFQTLKEAIQTDDLVTMRRYRNAEYWLKVFTEKAKYLQGGNLLD